MNKKVLSLIIIILEIKSDIRTHLILNTDEKIDRIDFSLKYEQWAKELEQKRIQILTNLKKITEKQNPQNQSEINKKHNKKALLVSGPLKSENSLLRKLETEYPIKIKKANNNQEKVKYKDFNDIKDFLRFTIVLVDPISQMPEIISEIESLYNIPIKDKNSFPNPKKSGYADRNTVFAYKDDIIDLDSSESHQQFEIKFEVQFQLCSFNIGKAVEHLFYEVIRVLNQLDEIKENGGKKFGTPSELFEAIGDRDGKKFDFLFNEINNNFVNLKISSLLEFKKGFRKIGPDGFEIDDEFVLDNYKGIVDTCMRISNWIYHRCSLEKFSKQNLCMNNMAFEISDDYFLKDGNNFVLFSYNYIKVLITAERLVKIRNIINSNIYTKNKENVGEIVKKNINLFI